MCRQENTSEIEKYKNLGIHLYVKIFTEIVILVLIQKLNI